MGKNSKKLRRQDFPSREDLREWDGEEQPARGRASRLTEPTEYIDKPATIRPPRAEYRSSGNNPFRDGQVVRSSDVIGTVAGVSGDTVMVLDPTGLLFPLHFRALSLLTD